MNRQNLERKELRLGTMQVVGLLGLSIGSIIAAFCLGFYSGRSFAFEKELTNALAGLPKLPVNADESGADLGEKIVSEVYAKLNEQNEQSESAESLPADEETAFPELGTIREAESPLSEDAEISDIDLEQPETGNIAAGNNEPAKQDPEKQQEQVLLGALNESRNSESEKVIQKSIAADKKPEESKQKELIVKEEAAAVKVAVPAVNTVPTVKALPTLKANPVVTEAAPLKLKEEKILPLENKSTAAVAKGWYAQIAAPKSVSDANAIASNLKKSGFPVAIETAEVRGEKYYRVIVGPENSKSQADVLLKQLKRESYITGDPFLRMVK